MTQDVAPDAAQDVAPDAAQDVAPDVARAASPRRVCFVTTEFHGLFKNGGIGTANTGLALALAEAGIDVTVAFAAADPDGPRLPPGSFAQAKASYLTRGIVLDYVPPHPGMPAAFDDPRPASLSVLAYLMAGRFDIVLFNDNGGQGYYPMLAKHTGVFPDAPLMLLVTHGPFDWVLELNSIAYWNRHPVIAAFMERRCAALADLLVSPSRYLIDWMRARGWTLPSDTRVIQNLVGPFATTCRAGWASAHHPTHSPPTHSPAAPSATHPIAELVFFGRLELRKGLALFCDALDLLEAAADLSATTVTFMGKFSNLGNLHAGVFVVERSLAWSATLRVASEFDQAQALAYLARPGVLAVIPSLAENSPCVVVECLALGLPFLASDSGGTAELIAPENHAACLFAPNPEALADRLSTVLRHGARQARLAVPQEAVRGQWLDLLQREHPAGAPTRPEPASATPLVSICLVQQGQTHLNPDCLLSIRRQTHAPTDIVIAWDGQGTCDHDATILRVAGAQPLLEAARAASGDYLLFVDDAAVTLLPGCIETLVRAARRSGADLLTGLPEIQPGLDPSSQARAIPLGACAELGALENCFGEAVILVARRCLSADHPVGAVLRDDTLHGAERACSLRDWMFLAAATLRGAVLEIVPLPLYVRQAASGAAAGGWHGVQRQRRLMRLYQDAPAGMFARIMEGLRQDDTPSGQQAIATLQPMPPAAAETARRLAGLEANAPEAQRAFISFCAQRLLPALAMDYAILNGAIHLAEAASAASQACGEAVMQMIRWRRVATWHGVDLSADIASRVRAIPPLSQSGLERGGGQVVSHALGPDIAALKAAGACPPGATSLRALARAYVPSARGTEKIRFALAVCDGEATLILADALRARHGSLAWSGWVECGTAGEPVEISVSLPEPPADPLDVYLLAQRAGAAHGAEIPVVWQAINAEILGGAAMSASRIERPARRLFVPPDVLHAGIVMTDVSDFPVPVYVPGERTLLHPVPGRDVLVRLQAACPAGALGVRAAVSLEHEQSRPVDFALWLRAPSGETEFFSAWHTVFDPLTRHHLSITLPEPARFPMDLYLGTRVSRSTDAYFCHAYWHEIWFSAAKEDLLF